MSYYSPQKYVSIGTDKARDTIDATIPYLIMEVRILKVIRPLMKSNAIIYISVKEDLDTYGDC